MTVLIIHTQSCLRVLGCVKKAGLPVPRPFCPTVLLSYGSFVHRPFCPFTCCSATISTISGLFVKYIPMQSSWLFQQVSPG